MKTIYFDEISSTNLYLKENYKSLDNLTLVCAKHQTEGRGRLGRTWVDSDDLLFSILIKENITQPTDYTFIIAVTILNVLKEYSIKPLIKWPNDIIVSKKKICGILLEGISETNLEAVVIGVGINANSKTFPKELFFKATSMYKELKTDVNKEELLQKIITEFEKNYQLYANHKLDFVKTVRDNLYLINQIVKFTYKNQDMVGIIQGLDDEGRLIINSRGEELHITSGEITLHNEY